MLLLLWYNPLSPLVFFKLFNILPFIETTLITLKQSRSVSCFVFFTSFIFTTIGFILAREVLKKFICGLLFKLAFAIIKKGLFYLSDLAVFAF